MTTNYKPLMTSAEIPWHNPAGLTPEQVDPESEGFRLITKDEVDCKWHDDCEYRSGSEWLKLNGQWHWNRLSTIRTKAPLPSKYAHLLEPDYSDPAYRASVEEAFRNGAAIEFRDKDSRDRGWRHVGYPMFIWTDYIYRAVSLEDPAPDSDAHKLAVLMAAIDGAEAQFQHENGHWYTESSLKCLRYSISRDLNVRIKPAPVKVPLSDYRVGEAVVHKERGIGVITSADASLILVQFSGRVVWFSHQEVLSELRIHRNGKWCDCFRLEEGGK